MKIKINKVRVQFTTKKNKIDNPLITTKALFDLSDGVYFIQLNTEAELSEFIQACENRLNDEEIYISAYFSQEIVKIKAAGGVVFKNDFLLLIFRLGFWDLPKGKLEKDEDKKDGALREVEEECNIKVRIDKKLCNTYHFYPLKKNTLALKKTYWYAMECVSDKKMKPQTNEGIEKVEWKTIEETNALVKNSYMNLKKVLSAFYKLKGIN